MKPGPSKLWPDVAPEWIQNLPEKIEDIFYDFYKCFIYDDRYQLYLDGLVNTLKLTLLALIMGVVIGVVIALVRSTWDKNRHELRGISKGFLHICNWICNIYVTVIRGTPVLVQLLIWWFVAFASSRDGISVAAFAFGINSGAYVAEIIRGGIMSIDPGQMEAGRSLGFGYVATMRHIILPQTLKAVLPSLANEFIVLLKETSVAAYVSVAELTYAGNIVGGISYDYLFPLLMTALIYLVMVTFFTFLVGKLERRLRTSER
ncbi:MAG: amino acid ABC transporter permease [Oscillospiraceae bacterium]|nr:amino acid ABC transporter permease [Oscillospiraceae bacterium]